MAPMTHAPIFKYVFSYSLAIVCICYLSLLLFLCFGPDDQCKNEAEQAANVRLRPLEGHHAVLGVREAVEPRDAVRGGDRLWPGDICMYYIYIYIYIHICRYTCVYMYINPCIHPSKCAPRMGWPKASAAARTDAMPVSVIKRKTPLEKKRRGNISFQNSESGTGEELSFCCNFAGQRLPQKGCCSSDLGSESLKGRPSPSRASGPAQNY